MNEENIQSAVDDTILMNVKLGYNDQQNRSQIGQFREVQEPFRNSYLMNSMNNYALRKQN